MGSLRILPSGIQIWRSTIIARTSVPQRWSQNGIHAILFFGSRGCALDNRWVVEGETLRIQAMICGRDAFKSLQVSSGMRGQKFGECFNCSHYFSSVGGQASTLMQPTEPTDIAAKWGIGLEVARCTLDCTTHRGLRTVIHPSLSRR